MFDTLRLDFARYHDARRPLGRYRSVVYALCAYGFLAVLLHRYGRWTHTVRPAVLGFALRLVYRVLKIPTELLLGIDISINSNIGPGLHIGHFGGIFLHCNAGARLSVGQGVTIGYKGAGKSDYWPRLGDDVYVGAGAKVIGDIEVGHRVIVGANTVVTKDVDDDMRVVGARVRVTRIEGRPRLPTGAPTDDRSRGRRGPHASGADADNRMRDAGAAGHDADSGERRRATDSERAPRDPASTIEGPAASTIRPAQSTDTDADGDDTARDAANGHATDTHAADGRFAGDASGEAAPSAVNGIDDLPARRASQ